MLHRPADRDHSALGENDLVKIQHRLIALDSADLAEESNFWAQVLGGTVDTWDEAHMVVVDGQPQIGVQLVPDHVLPEWPKGIPHRIRLDLWVEDPGPSHELVMSLGARLLDDPEDDGEPGNGYRVYADPAGHPFALCWRK